MRVRQAMKLESGFLSTDCEPQWDPASLMISLLKTSCKSNPSLGSLRSHVREKQKNQLFHGIDIPSKSCIKLT
jgi:hypothetical protein